MAWDLVDGHHLERTFSFPDFASGLAFVNAVGAIAEEHDHHPDVYLAWGKVRIEIRTHSKDAVTHKDHALAAAIDRIPPLILLLDGMSMLYRSFFALPPMTTTRGEPTGGLYGFSSLLCKLLREEEPLGVAVAMDTPALTVRQASYPAYKAGRQVAPDPLRSQIALLPELVRAMGAPLHRVPGQEADDVLATLARRIEHPVLVVSGDTDLAQLVDDRVTHLFVGRRQKEHVRFDPAAVRARWGFEPRLLPTFKAMAGDPSDNLPGILGVGATTARRLCANYGDAAAILEALDAGRIGNRRLPPVLEASRDALLRWEALGRLDAHLPLEEPLWAPVDRDGLRAFFERFEFKSLLGRL